MNLTEYKKLEDKINSQDFHKSYNNINNVMFYLSIFGHLASIFLAFFLVQGILSTAVTNPIVSIGSTIILLSGLELLKREIFDKLSLHQLKYGFNKGIRILLFSSLVVSSLSFYATVTGAREFSSQQKTIDKKSEEIVVVYQDSIKSIYNEKISKLENEISNYKDKITEKDKEQTEIESVQPLTSQQRNRVRDLKAEKVILREDIIKLESDITKLKSDLELEISKYAEQIKEKSKTEKDENKSNIIFFIFISSLIEFMILGGVYFNEYYKYRSYREFKSKIEKDPNYQNWIMYNSFLDIIYGESTKVNDKLPNSKAIHDICKIQGINLLQKDILSMIKLLISMDIIKNGGSVKYIAKSKETAQEIVKSHFNIK